MKRNADQVIGFIVLVALAVVARLAFQDIPNFAPVAAVALFAGYAFRSAIWAVAVPVCVMLISDCFLGGYEMTVMIAVYFSLTWPVLLRGPLRRHLRTHGGARTMFSNTLLVMASALGASVLFFAVTNLAVWATWYDARPEMLLPCYLQALPFFRYTLLGDLSFAATLFGSYAVYCALKQSAEKEIASARQISPSL